MGLFVALILVFLQPFDTYTHQTPYKNLKLSGYFLPVAIAVLLLHIPENILYRQLKRQWKVRNEVLSILLLLAITSILTYFHLALVVNENIPSVHGYFEYTQFFALPFAVVLVPFFLYLRARLGKITVEVKVSGGKQETRVAIQGDNQGEEVVLLPSEFVYAKSMQNYVEVFFLREGRLEKAVLRLTLRGLLAQLSTAWQVHRSYLINLQYADHVEGNARKRQVVLKEVETSVPVSQKHYESLQKHLQTHPKTS